ncbi:MULTISPECIES: hypothetical protein [unclassified Lonepinella]|uniref:hypothetical protein n=1 Tax=unclassified Lonepinella TaxID=2642006 RepID=UPI003F6E3B82
MKQNTNAEYIQYLKNAVRMLSKANGVLARDYEAKVADFQRFIRQGKYDDALVAWHEGYSLLELKLYPVARSLKINIQKLKRINQWG